MPGRSGLFNRRNALYTRRMDASRFARGMETLVRATPHLGGRDPEAVLIMNPRAGGFSHRARYQSALRAVDAALAAAGSPRPGRLSWRVMATAEPRHASRMASELLDEAAMKHSAEWLVVLACGDGTSLEFLDTVSRAPAELRERFTVLRLPMGTGNDGSDGRELADSLSRLGPAGRVAEQAALRVIPAPGGPASRLAPDGEWRAFNIASVGLDAYVTDMTNRLKASLPGDSYRLWLDLASVLYDRIWPPRPMELVATGPGNAPAGSWTGEFLLAAMGVSGRRTYGSNKPILPGDENVCAIRQMPLLRKLALKGPIASGRHREFPEALLFSADTLEIRYADRLLVQMDGEAERLAPEDFPLRIERTAPLVRHLARADGRT